MKITCVIHSLAGGGAERVMAGLASSLAQRNHRVTLITLGDAQQDRHTTAPAVRRIALDLLGPRRGPLSGVANNTRRATALRQAILATQPEVVLSFCDRTNVLTLLSLLGTSIPVVVSERSNPAAQLLPWPWSWLRTVLYRRAATVIALTPAAAKTVERWSRRPPLVIPSAVQPPPAEGQPSPAAVAGRSGQVVLGIGRLEHEKGFDQLLQAFAAVADQHPRWTLRIHGEGSCRAKLERQREDLRLTGRVEFPGWTRPIWPALQQADLFVLPSRYEGFPSALLEAMAAGLACIAVDCPDGPGVIVREGVDALLVPAGDTAALAAAMDRCMSDPSLRQALGRRAVEVTERFSWAAMVDAYERVLLSQ